MVTMLRIVRLSLLLCVMGATSAAAFFPKQLSVRRIRTRTGTSPNDTAKTPQADDNDNSNPSNLFRRPPSLSELFSTSSSKEESESEAASSAKGNGSNNGGNAGPAPVSAFEDMVRKVTNNPEYRFGDLTKSAVSVGTHAVEDVVHNISGNDSYHFGDITKGTIKKVSKTSSNVLQYSEKTLSLMREANIHELVALSRFFWTENLTYEQRRECVVVAIYLGAVLVLAYNLVANINAGLVNAAAWHMASIKVGGSPLVVTGGWDAFLNAKGLLSLFFSGPLLPARVAVTIPLFFRYQHWIRGLEKRLPTRNNFPILTRIFSLFIMWVVCNLAAYSGVSVGVAWLASLMSGIPLR